MKSSFSVCSSHERQRKSRERIVAFLRVISTGIKQMAFVKAADVHTFDFQKGDARKQESVGACCTDQLRQSAQRRVFPRRSLSL